MDVHVIPENDLFQSDKACSDPTRNILPGGGAPGPDCEENGIHPEDGCFAGSSVDLKQEKSHSLGFRQMSCRERMVIVLISLSALSESAVYSCLAPFFPLEATKKNATDTEIALILGIFQLVVFLTSPFWGRFMSRFGSKFLFTTGIMVCGYCSALFGLLEYTPAGTKYIATAFSVRIIEAMGAGAYLTAGFAIIAHEFPNKVSTAFGTMELFSGVGYLIGPLLGSALFQLGGFKLPFIVLGCFVVLNGIATWRFLPSASELHSLPLSSHSGTVWQLCRNPKIATAIISVFAGSAALGLVTATFSKHLDQQHAAAYVIGIAFAVPSVTYALAAPLTGFLTDKKGYGFGIMSTGSLLITGAFLLAGPAPFIDRTPSIWMNIVGAGLLGIGVACTNIPPFAIGLKASFEMGFPDNYNTYGLVSGLMSSAIALSTFTGASVGGVAVEHFGFPWITAGASGVTLIVALGIFIFACLMKIRTPSIKYKVLENSSPAY